MIIEYKDTKLKNRCTNIREAKKFYNKKVAEALHFVINYIENSETLADIKAFTPFNLHPLQGSRAGTYAIDLGGRKSGFRLILCPLDEDNNEWIDADINTVYKSTKIIILLEVTNHYE